MHKQSGTTHNGKFATTEAAATKNKLDSEVGSWKLEVGSMIF